MSKKIDAKSIRRSAADWLKVMFLLLDEAGAVVLIVLIFRFLGIKIPLVVTIFLALIFGTLIFIIHMAVIPTFHRQQVTGREGMIGLQGSVVESLTPKGSIAVKGEHWKAVSVDEHICKNGNVEIVGIDGLTLKVRRKE